jgi:biofilm protein TabA
MILTQIGQLPEQIEMTPRFEIALQFLHRQDLGDLPDGRIDLDGDKVYALVQSVVSKPLDEEIEVEGHKKYIDIHYLPAGREIIGWVYGEGIEVEGTYDGGKDVWKARVPKGQVTLVKLSAGQLLVCFPTDAHAPRLLESPGVPLKKIVMKVAVS